MSVRRRIIVNRRTKTEFFYYRRGTKVKFLYNYIRKFSVRQLARSESVYHDRKGSCDSYRVRDLQKAFVRKPRRNYVFSDVTRHIDFLPYGVTVDEFQHWVYENPNATPAERDAKWCELERKYTPYVVDTYHDCTYRATGHRWLTQGHIFQSPFYYIDYTLAQVMAFQFFNLDRKNHKLAWSRYIKLCKMGGKYPFVTLVKKDGMKSPFDEGVLHKTIRPLVKQLKSYNV